MGKVAKRVLIVIVVLVAVFFGASYAIDSYILGQTYAKRDQVIQPGGSMPTFADYAGDHSRVPVEFTMDGGTLRGYVYQADGVSEPKGFVIFRHGIFSNHGFYLPEIMALADRGWKVFAYDAIGAGESDGDSYIGMAQSAIDVSQAVTFAKETGLSGDLPIALWGHSWGGYGVAAALNNVPWVSACVTMSGFNEPVEILVESAKGFAGPLAATQYPTLWLNNKIAFGDAANVSAVNGINSSDIPVLIIHATNDTVVSHDGAGIIAHRGELTNQHVEFYEPSEEGRNGHNSYFYSKEATEYGNAKRAELDALTAQYPDGLPEDVRAGFYAGYDVLRANVADPYMMDLIDDFLTRAIGGSSMSEQQGFTPLNNDEAKKEKSYGALESALFSDSGNSMGNLYSIETAQADDGSMIVIERRAEMHSVPITVREFRAPADIVKQVEGIVDSAGMKEWGELPMSDLIALDASTERISLTFKDATPGSRWHVYLSMTEYDIQPDDGKAFNEIRDLLRSCLSDENLIREYTEPVRQ